MKEPPVYWMKTASNVTQAGTCLSSIFHAVSDIVNLLDFITNVLRPLSREKD